MPHALEDGLWACRSTLVQSKTCLYAEVTLPILPLASKVDRTNMGAASGDVNRSLRDRQGELQMDVALGSPGSGTHRTTRYSQLKQVTSSRLPTVVV